MRFFVLFAFIACLSLGVRTLGAFLQSANAQSAEMIGLKLKEMSQNMTEPAGSVRPSLEPSNPGVNTTNASLLPLEIIDQDEENEIEEKKETPAAAPSTRRSSGSFISNNEQALLEELGERRNLIEQMEENIQRRQALLTAAEKQLIERQNEIEKLNKKISKMMDEFASEKEGARSSVMMTYNVMKPRAAAAIFNEMSVNVLIGVIQKMEPRKLALIMAEMDPLRARDLTTVLANKEIAIK